MKDLTPEQISDIELTEDELKLVLGGAAPRRPKQSKVCDVGGGCWPDTSF